MTQITTPQIKGMFKQGDIIEIRSENRKAIVTKESLSTFSSYAFDTSFTVKILSKFALIRKIQIIYYRTKFKFQNKFPQHTK